jgi:hypothetical protein
MSSNMLKVNRRFGEHVALMLFSIWFTLVSCLPCSSTMNMEATCSSETSADFLGTTRRFIPEDRTLQIHHSENLKSCVLLFTWRVTLSGTELKARICSKSIYNIPRASSVNKSVKPWNKCHVTVLRETKLTGASSDDWINWHFGNNLS